MMDQIIGCQFCGSDQPALVEGIAIGGKQTCPDCGRLLGGWSSAHIMPATTGLLSGQGGGGGTGSYVVKRRGI